MMARASLNVRLLGAPDRWIRSALASLPDGFFAVVGLDVNDNLTSPRWARKIAIVSLGEFEEFEVTRPLEIERGSRGWIVLDAGTGESLAPDAFVSRPTFRHLSEFVLKLWEGRFDLGETEGQEFVPGQPEIPEVPAVPASEGNPGWGQVTIELSSAYVYYGQTNGQIEFFGPFGPGTHNGPENVSVLESELISVTGGSVLLSESLDGSGSGQRITIHQIDPNYVGQYVQIAGATWPIFLVGYEEPTEEIPGIPGVPAVPEITAEDPAPGNAFFLDQVQKLAFFGRLESIDDLNVIVAVEFTEEEFPYLF